MLCITHRARFRLDALSTEIARRRPQKLRSPIPDKVLPAPPPHRDPCHQHGGCRPEPPRPGHPSASSPSRAQGMPLSQPLQPDDLWCADLNGELMLADYATVIRSRSATSACRATTWRISTTSRADWRAPKTPASVRRGSVYSPTSRCCALQQGAPSPTAAEWTRCSRRCS